MYFYLSRTPIGPFLHTRGTRSLHPSRVKSHYSNKLQPQEFAEFSRRIEMELFRMAICPVARKGITTQFLRKFDYHCY